MSRLLHVTEPPSPCHTVPLSQTWYVSQLVRIGCTDEQDKGEADGMLAYVGAEATAQIGQLVAILLMALALGMDAFSLGLGIGMKGIRLKDMLKISLVVGMFHVIMPLAGMFAGSCVSVLLGNVAALCGGLLLIILGMHMVFNSLRGEQMEAVFDHRTLFGMLIFSFSVSIDSFSVGITLGLFQADIMLTVTLFGFFGCVMSVCGLLLGRRFSGIFGDYGEAIGGIILIVFGTKFLW